MNLSNALLICAIIAGLSGGMAARYRRWGTSLSDLGTGLLVAVLFSTVSVVVLVLVAGLNFFGIIHLVYLILVVGFPLGVAWIVIPNLLDVERRTPIVASLLALLGIGAVAVGLWSTHVEPFRLQVETEVLGATGATQPIIIGVIADLQTTAITDYENAALERVLEGEPDLVVLPGDLFQLDEEDIPAALPEFLGWLRRLSDAVDHVVIVAGNVDKPGVVEELAEEAGITYLDDELVVLDVGGQDVTIVGMSFDIERGARQMDETLAAQLQEETSENDLVIAVSHFPDVVLDFTEDSTIDLVVAGHTHGGQVSLPRIGPLFTASDVPREVGAGGLHVLNGHPIYVSTGVGLERGQAPQLRFGVPPSIALITIVP